MNDGANRAGCWVIGADSGAWGGMVAAARSLGGPITAVAAGDRVLAEEAAAAGADAVRWYDLAEGAPPEALRTLLAADAAAAPRIVLSLPDAASRVVWAAVVAELGAPALGAVVGLGRDGESVLVTRYAAQGKALETLATDGPLAAVFDGADLPWVGEPAPITRIAAPGTDFLRLLEAADEAGAEEADLKTAERVVGIGLGVRKRERLVLAESVAAKLGAALACSLPVCEDLAWFGESRVIGVSSNRIKPQLYLMLGISGSPQHMTAVRDARIIAAVNIDPEASIFSKCHYGIVGDLAEVLPALLEVL
ncbi:MAG: FAD-binding protein [Gracilibacteraceae bacterium]|nr:FAD-binding protein [Gracilibacteraceae bacterium]